MSGQPSFGFQAFPRAIVALLSGLSVDQENVSVYESTCTHTYHVQAFVCVKYIYIYIYAHIYTYLFF